MAAQCFFSLHLHVLLDVRLQNVSYDNCCVFAFPDATVWCMLTDWHLKVGQGAIVQLHLWDPISCPPPSTPTPYITWMCFFSSLSRSTQEPPRSSLYIPVVVIATGQHPSPSFVQCLPHRLSFPGRRWFGFCMQIETPSFFNWASRRGSGRGFRWWMFLSGFHTVWRGGKPTEMASQISRVKWVIWFM